MAELWYNTKFHTATQLTPLEALYGYPAPIPMRAQTQQSLVEVINYNTKTRDAISRLLQINLNKTQNRMKPLCRFKQPKKSYLILLKKIRYMKCTTSLDSTK